VSLDYEYATIDVDILVHPKALAAGVEAMGLWLWAMAWSHKTGANGRIPRHVVALAWGGTTRTITRLARQLVASGLWLETETGWEIWNYGKKNQSAEEKERRKKQGRERMARFRDKSRDARSDAPCDASQQRHVTREDAAPVFVTAPDLKSSGGAGGAQPTWWAEAIATAEQAVGGTIDQAGARWLEYDSSRERKGWSRNHRDAVGWLTTVIRTERKNQRAPPASRAAEITKQPFDPDAPWMQDDYTGALKKTGTT
jgi:hypothetical protein